MFREARTTVKIIAIVVQLAFIGDVV